MTIRRLFPIILVCFLAILAVAVAPDPDMWWHLRTGESILLNGLPQTDIYSYTMPGTPWLTHEWLTEVVMWTVYRIAGFGGLNLAFAAVVVAAFWVSYLTCDGRPYVACLVISLAALVAFGSIGVRPQMLNLLFFALFVFVIERFRDRSAVASGRVSASSLWLLPALTILWANCHSGFMLGVALLLAYALGEGLQARFGAPAERVLDWRGIRSLVLTAAGCLAAALLNPHGYRLFAYSYETLGARYVANGWVLEWASPNFHDVTIWPFAGMLALGAMAWAFSPKRASVTDVALFAGTGAAGLYSARHMALFAIAGAPIVCRALVQCVEGSPFHSELTGPVPEKSTTQHRVLYWAVAAGMAALAIVHAEYNLRAFDRATMAKFPVAAVDFIEREGMAGHRVYNHYGWGGYLIWRGIPVFIDGRADVYGDEFIRTYVKAQFVMEDWRRPLDEYGVEYALVGRDSRLRTVLLATGKWREAYSDHVAAVLVRAT